MGNTKLGLYRKFKVERTDGRSAPGEKHHNCRYFVIDLDHDKFAAETISKYADLCKEEYPELAKDLNQTSLELEAEKCPHLFEI